MMIIIIPPMSAFVFELNVQPRKFNTAGPRGQRRKTSTAIIGNTFAWHGWRVRMNWGD